MKNEFVYLVWNQDDITCPKTLLKIFETEENANKYSEEFSFINYSFCYVEKFLIN